MPLFESQVGKYTDIGLIGNILWLLHRIIGCELRASRTTPERYRIYISTRIYLILILTLFLKFTGVIYSGDYFWTKNEIELQNDIISKRVKLRHLFYLYLQEK